MKSKPLLQIVLVALCIVLSTSGVLDRIAAADHSGLWQRALVTFALARTLNGVISTVQGTEVALQPAGFGLTLTPGEILDPVNDLVERFSWIMLAATVSLGLQEFLLEIGQAWPMRILLVALGLAWVALMLLGRRPRGPNDAGLPAARFVFGAFLCVALLRLSIPLTIILNERLYDSFLESRYAQSSNEIATAGEMLTADDKSAPEAAADPAGADESPIMRWMRDARTSLDFRARVEQVKQKAAEIVDHLIRLSVVFILQTALVPLLFAWLLLKSLGWVARASFRAD